MGVDTYALDSRPKDASNRGDNPMTEHTIEIVTAVLSFVLSIVATCAPAPMILSVQKIVKNIQPLLFEKPCFQAT